MNKIFIAKIAWFMLNILWIIFIVFYTLKLNEKDIDIVFLFGEILLSFPSGLLLGVIYPFVMYVISFISQDFHSYLIQNYFEDSFLRAAIFIIIGFINICIGYLQWFIVVPKLIKWLKRKKN